MPGFEQDIRPLFRDKDVEDMRFAMDLSQYGDVKDNAENIYSRLQDQTMPCDDPWPAERIGLFRRWMDEGFAP